jgi:predicted Zn-ribbon and HTH transcriptional regulator
MMLRDLLSFPSDDSLVPKGPSELREAAALLRQLSFSPYGLSTAIRLEALAGRFEAALESEMLLVCPKCHGTGCKRAALVIEDWSKCPRCAEERTRCKPVPERTLAEDFPRLAMASTHDHGIVSPIMRAMNKTVENKNLAEARDMLLVQENKGGL